MSLHDEYARLTPYELLFADDATARELVSALDEESAGRGADPDSLHAFVTMGVVTDFIRQVEGEGAPPESIHQYGALAFHALHFHRSDRPLYLLTAHAARYLVEGVGGSEPVPPAPAGYLQLPQHLFWLDDGSGTPQSVDGIFWKTTEGAGRLDVLLVTGVRADRTGLGVVPLPEAPLSDAPGWLELDARGDGTDYANSMPGADLDALYLFATSGEVFKLLARFFAYASAVPGALVGVDAVDSDGEPDPSGGAAGPEPSRLDFTRVTLEG